MMNVCEDAAENVVEDVRDTAEIGEAAEDKTPALGHGQTVRNYVGLRQTRLENLQMIHFIISNLEIKVKDTFAIVKTKYLFPKRSPSR